MSYGGCRQDPLLSYFAARKEAEDLISAFSALKQFLCKMNMHQASRGYLITVGAKVWELNGMYGMDHLYHHSYRVLELSYTKMAC